MERKQRNLILLIVIAVLLLLLFIILSAVYFHRAADKTEITSSSGEIIADEARSDVVVESIIGESGESSAVLSSSESSSPLSDMSSGASSGTSARSSGSSSLTGSDSPVQISDDSGEWNLRLVSAAYMLPDDFSPTLSTISMDYARDKGMKFDSRAIDALESMCAAAKQDGVSLMVISAYRSFTTQQTLYNRKVNYYLEQGYDDDEAGDLAATVVARPKTSEHNLGLAVDLNSVEEDFDQTAAFDWLQIHCASYGFILRYPKEKQDITGVIYEPWHYRYVGVSAAEQITKKGITLEEYLGKE